MRTVRRRPHLGGSDRCRAARRVLRPGPSSPASVEGQPMTVEFTVAIPARFGASRLPGKPLRLIAGRALVLRVVDRALAAGAREVAVATDDERIAAAVQGSGATVCMTRADHPSGTDRLAEVAAQRGWRDDQIVVNLQGD